VEHMRTKMMNGDSNQILQRSKLDSKNGNSNFNTASNRSLSNYGNGANGM